MANFGDFTQFGSTWLTQSLQDFNSTTATLVVRGTTISDINVTILSVYQNTTRGNDSQADVSVEQRQFVVRRSDLAGNVIAVGDMITLTLGGDDITFRVVAGNDGQPYCDYDRFKELVSFDAVQYDSNAVDEGWI